MRRPWFFGLLSLALTACGPTHANDEAAPDTGQPPATDGEAQVTLTLTWEELGSLGGDDWLASITITPHESINPAAGSIAAVSNAAVGTTHGSATPDRGTLQEFLLPRGAVSATLTLEKLPVGKMHLDIALHTRNGRTMAGAAIVLDVMAGTQVLPNPVIAKLITLQPDASPSAAWRDVPIKLALLRPDSNTPPLPLMTYDRDVKPIIDTHCKRCHLPVARGGGLDLSSFPFVSVLRDESTTALASRVLDRMRATTYPMPPGEPRPAAEVDVIAAWITGGLGTDVPDVSGEGDAKHLHIYYRLQGLTAEHHDMRRLSDDTRQLQWILPGLATGSHYEFRFVFTDAADAVLATVNRTLAIDAQSDLTLSLNVPVPR